MALKRKTSEDRGSGTVVARARSKPSAPDANANSASVAQWSEEDAAVVRRLADAARRASCEKGFDVDAGASDEDLAKRLFG
jgi:3-methyladenine DNA glycosylase AlkC